MDPIFYLIAGTGLFFLAIVLLWITGNTPKFIPDCPIQLAPRRWTKKQLYEIAKEHNIDGRSKMSRDRLLRVTTGLRPRTRPLKAKPERKPQKSFKLSGSELIDYKKEGFRVAGKMGRELRDIKRLSPDVTFSGKFDPNTWTFIIEKQEPKPKSKKPSKRHLEKEVRLNKQQEYDEFLKKLPIGERKQYPVQQYIYERNLTTFGDGRLARYQKKIVTKEVVGVIETKPGVKVKKIETGQDKKILNKKGYQVVITTLEKPVKDPFKRKKIRPPSIDMSQNTPQERIDALYSGLPIKGVLPIKGATLEERRIAREAREMGKMSEQWGGALEAALERKSKHKKKRPGIGKLTPFEKQIMKEKNLTPIQAKRLVERIELLGASRGDSANLYDISAMPIQDIEEVDKAVMEIEREQAMADFIAESYAAEWAQHAPKRRFFPSINPNITFRLSRNNQKACYPINKPQKTKRKRSN